LFAILLCLTFGSAASFAQEWELASGNIWTGVVLYFGQNKMEVGTIQGGNDDYISPTGQKFRGVKLTTDAGTVEWKDRDAIATGDWYVKADDPALTQYRWEILSQ